MGVCSPLKTLAMSSGSMSSSSSSTSSSSLSYSSTSPSASRSAGSSTDIMLVITASLPRSPRSKSMTFFERRSRTPRKRSPLPMGQTTGQHVMPNSASISPQMSYGVRAGRSSLLTKVKSGSRRSRATSKSLRVCGSRPLAASTSMTALSAAASVRYVSSEKSWCPGVSRIDTCFPEYS